MSPLSTEESPHSTTATIARPYPLPSRDGFSFDISPSSLMAMATDTTIKSPVNFKNQRTPSFSRDSMLGTSQKSRHLSQSSDNNRADNMTNGSHKLSSDEGSNPLKRRNTDVGIDYPRRRATIAVRRTICLVSTSFIL